ncbi:MAG: hypothetical protein Q7V31_04830 [Parvibaculum sp.]|uniref:hypothetical protein n=1 Tax=Parvibaculum sp. TaxID=2024848 RepID=UPI00271F55EE|nr:hypothetical protein [Parvibaculum sp.]MDO8838231.1 hypothetical protein [Parvibaculum sp.]
MRIKKLGHFAYAVCIAASLNGCSEQSNNEISDEYLSQLDLWVDQGGEINEIQTELVEPCGKLVMAKGSTADRAAYISTRQEDFHMMVDICVKLTVHRVYPQPEFENPKIVATICGAKDELLTNLCDRSSLK